MSSQSEFKSKGGWQRIPNALSYSKDGLKAAWQHEAAFRQLLILHSFLLFFVWVPDFSIAIRMILILASFLSLAVELLNSGIEAVVDYISLERHPLAKRAKDVGSAAQLLILMMTFILWIIALIN